MLVADVMTRNVVSVRPADPYKKAVERMLAASVSGMPVVDEDQAIVGMLTEADLMAKEAYGAEPRRPLAVVSDLLLGHDTKWIDKAAARTVADVMTRNVVSASSDESVHDVARRMLELRVKRLPVIDDGRLVGIVSRRDVLGVFRGSDDALRRRIEATLRDPTLCPELTEFVCFVWDGEVLLEGSVVNSGDIDVVGNVVRRMPGVVTVHNNLIAERGDKSRHTEDIRSAGGPRSHG